MDLIERLRALARHEHSDVSIAEEAAAALEEAREDAERWRQAFVDERASRYRADGMKIEQARIHAETDAEVGRLAIVRIAAEIGQLKKEPK